MQKPIAAVRKLVVVVRIAQAEEAQYMLVDEIEVEEPVHIAHRGMVAHRVALVGIGQSAKNVPRRGNARNTSTRRQASEPSSAAIGRSAAGKERRTQKKTGAISPLVSSASPTQAHIQ